MTRYLVQEFVAGRWFTVRSYTDRAEAEAHVKWIGAKGRIRELST